MEETNDSGSSASAEAPTPEAPQQDTAPQQPPAPPRAPDFKPPAGKKYTMKDGVWHLQHDEPAPQYESREAVDENDENEQQAESLPGVLELPVTDSTEAQHDPGVEQQLGELASLGAEAGFQTGELQAMTNLAYDLFGSFGAETTGRDPHDELDADRTRAAMNKEWDQGRWDAMKKAYDGLPQRARKWLESTGLGNRREVCEILAEIGLGTFRIMRDASPEKRKEIVAYWRGHEATRDSQHKEHKSAVLRLRMASHLAGVLNDDSSRERSEKRFQDALDARRAEKAGKKRDPTTADLDRQIADLRRSPAYWDKSNPAHKEVMSQFRALMAKRWPD